MSELKDAARAVYEIWLSQPDPTKMITEMFAPMGLLKAAIDSDSGGNQPDALTKAEMMERSATCFEKAGFEPQASSTHHAWRKAGELWRTQAGVQTPQEEAEGKTSE